MEYIRPNILEANFTLNLGGDVVALKKPIVMGILNVTPDSFYDGGKFETDVEICLQTEKMLIEGATIIDVGGASSKPNAVEIEEKVEIERIRATIKLLIKTFPNIKISIDTFRSSVAEVAINEGAILINDVSGGDIDTKMFATVAKLNVPYILMHSRGNPQTMALKTAYNDMVLEIAQYFQHKVQRLKEEGVKDIILDLGFGFAKNLNQNYELLKKMPYFKMLNLPILVGVSRKSMIYKYLQTSADEALNGTTVLNTIALINGAKILRVHDVKQAVEAVNLFGKTFSEIENSPFKNLL